MLAINGRMYDELSDEIDKLFQSQPDLFSNEYKMQRAAQQIAAVFGSFVEAVTRIWRLIRDAFVQLAEDLRVASNVFNDNVFNDAVWVYRREYIYMNIRPFLGDWLAEMVAFRCRRRWLRWLL